MGVAADEEERLTPGLMLVGRATGVAADEDWRLSLGLMLAKQEYTADFRTRRPSISSSMDRSSSSSSATSRRGAIGSV